MTHAAIVTTTIQVPRCLDDLLADAARNPGPLAKLTVVVVGDRKSAAGTGEYLTDLALRTGIDVQWWSFERQKEWLARFPALDEALPPNSIQRRNVGYLLAAEAGARVVISIDDDNFLGPHPFLPHHLRVGTEVSAREVRTDGGLWDPCRLMASERGRRVHHRGYPFQCRLTEPVESHRPVTRRVAVNVGLWTGVPDANAFSHVEDPATFTGFAPDAVETFVADDVQAPYNSQNTAWDVALLPCSFLIVMGDVVDGQVIGRYDDVWQSYFARMVLRALPAVGGVLYGRPLLEQRRNPHDFLHDMGLELPGARMTEKLLPFFQGERLGGATPHAATEDLLGRLEPFVEQGPFTESERAFWRKARGRMKAWLDACRSLGH